MVSERSGQLAPNQRLITTTSHNHIKCSIVQRLQHWQILETYKKVVQLVEEQSSQFLIERFAVRNFAEDELLVRCDARFRKPHIQTLQPVDASLLRRVRVQLQRLWQQRPMRLRQLS